MLIPLVSWRSVPRAREQLRMEPPGRPAALSGGNQCDVSAMVFSTYDRGKDQRYEAMIGGESMPRIEGYRFGHLVVDGEEQTRDVIVLPERVLTNWWRADGHRLVLADLEDVIDELPERLIVGTGAYAQMRPDPAALEQLRQRGVEVEALPTDEAVRRYGELDPRRTAAALHLTC
jgi:hypothetical protein